MKKTSKLLGAVALSATLALGCAVPAFAADEYGTAVGEQQEYVKKQNETVATDVKIATMVTNINVAVPLDVTIVADAAGADILHPSAGVKQYDASGAFVADSISGYRIENYSTYPIAIKGIAVTDNSNGQWELVESIAANGETTGGPNKVGDLALTLAPSAVKAWNASVPTVNEGDKSGNSTAVALHSAVTAAQNPGWIVDRKVSDTEPSIMGLLLQGQSSALKNVNEPSILLGDKDNQLDSDPVKADDAFKIIYTVGAASTAA